MTVDFNYSQAKSLSLFETLTEGVVEQNETGEITFFNKAATLILDRTEDELQGKSSTDPDWNAIREDGSPYPGEEHPAMVALQTGERQTNQIMGLQYPDGEVRWILINSTPIDEAGKRTAITTFADITILKKAALDLERKVAEMEKMNKFMVDRELDMVKLKKQLDEKD